MKKHTFTLLITLSILLTITTNLFATGGNMGGPTQDGSPDHPYLIQDFADFNEFASDANYWNDCIRLETDVNLAGIPYTTAVIAPDTIIANYDFDGTPFEGIFDGNNHTINNLTINTAGVDKDSLGLFGRIDGFTAEVKNLGVEDVNIVGGDNFIYLGGLCGSNGSHRNPTGGTITNCYVTGAVIGGDNTYVLSGLCGSNNGGTISDCYAAVTVTGGDNSECLGGLCGENWDGGTIINCYATGAVTGKFLVGGLCGENWSQNTTITNCYATGEVIGIPDPYTYYLGGLCGQNYGIINNSYATGLVTGEGNAHDLGGLCGSNWEGTIINCYATGAVDGNTYNGGLCGYNRSNIINCYATGAVDGNTYNGGLCGIQQGPDAEINNCFWDIETSEMAVGYNLYPSSPGTITNVVGKTTAEMKIVSTFLDAGWDLVAVWNIEQGQTYPLLRKYSAFDTNYDNKINFTDFAEFANHWLGGVDID